MTSSLGPTFRGTLQRVSKVLSAVSHLRGPGDKLRFLSQDPEARSIVPLLRFVTDPSVTFGITRKVAENALRSPSTPSIPQSAEPDSVVALLREMHQGKWSRPSLRDPMLGHLAAKHKLDGDEIEAFVRLLDRNLKVGLGPARWRELSLTTDQQKELDAMMNKSTGATPSQSMSPTATSATQTPSARLMSFPGTALGYPFKGKLDPADYFVSRKLDGVRMLAIVNPNPTSSASSATQPIVECYSRTGKPLSVPDVVISDLARVFSSQGAHQAAGSMTSWVIDGELCVAGSSPGAADDFDRVISTVRTTRNDASASSRAIHYYIFDALTLDEFVSKSSQRVLSDRLAALLAKTSDAKTQSPSVTVATLSQDAWSIPIPNTSHLHLLTHQRIHGSTDLARVGDLMLVARSQGWEGLIVRKDTTYRGARHRDVLKVKHFVDAEFTVVGVDVDAAFPIPRPMLPPVLGPDLAAYLTLDAQAAESVVVAPYTRAVLVDVPGGQRVAVGSGMSLLQRLEWARHPERIVGSQVTVQFFEKTKDGSLRFPSLKAVYGPEGRDV